MRLAPTTRVARMALRVFPAPMPDPLPTGFTSRTHTATHRCMRFGSMMGPPLHPGWSNALMAFAFLLVSLARSDLTGTGRGPSRSFEGALVLAVRVLLAGLGELEGRVARLEGRTDAGPYRAAPVPVVHVPTGSEGDDPVITAALDEGNLIGAIKRYRELTSAGLGGSPPQSAAVRPEPMASLPDSRFRDLSARWLRPVGLGLLWGRHGGAWRPPGVRPPNSRKNARFDPWRDACRGAGMRDSDSPPVGRSLRLLDRVTQTIRARRRPRAGHPVRRLGLDVRMQSGDCSPARHRSRR